jgi:hypothetical protein
MAELDLEAIDAREKAATPGEWRVRPHGRTFSITSGQPGSMLIVADVYDDPPDLGGTAGRPDADFIAAARTDVPALIAEVERLRGELNTPEVNDFLEGVRREAAHQRARWSSAHDAGKTDADWFWLVGYLVGKALNKSEKRLHHLITAAAALFNWHLYTIGKTDMRPGIEPPPEVDRG